MEQKFIHYCWFGDKPLPKLAKKCIKSWKKYLPDYKIVRWSEENVNLEECPFIKEAYEAKKWAFVADYARTKAICVYGGIYFDTDMIVKKDISFLLNQGTVLGMEDSRMANAAVWIENKPNSWFARQMLNFYQSQEHFNPDNMYSISIPRMINKLIKPLGFDQSSDKIQHLKNDVTIYPREYFYPLSYNYQNNVFTKNTCMIHYFDATWIPKKEQFEMKMIRKIGKGPTKFVFNAYRFVRRNTKRLLKVLLFPIVIYRNYNRKYSKEYNAAIDNTEKLLNKAKKEYVVFHNPKWFGVTSATTELFENRIPCGELYRRKDIKKIGDTILKRKIKQVIFSAMCIGWKDLAIYLKSKNPKIKIKTFWHGSHSQVLEPYGWARNIEIIELHKQGIINVMGTCKESLVEFYKNEKCNSFFITNRVSLENIDIKKKKHTGVKIGIYASASDSWHKNMFSQIAAASFIKNAKIDMVPMSKAAKRFAGILGIEIEGVEKPISREELIKRMADNDINLYTTFTECAPMLPLESFEVGVPCVSGNNHHYFKGKELEKYIIVKNEENPVEIAEQIKKCLKNKTKIMKLYNTFRKQNDKSSRKSVEEFLKM